MSGFGTESSETQEPDAFHLTGSQVTSIQVIWGSDPVNKNQYMSCLVL